MNDPMAHRFAEHKRFLEDNNPSVLRGQKDPNSYLSSVGEQASQMFRDLMMKFRNSPEANNLPHLELVKELQNRRESALEIVRHDLILQPVPEYG